jgi:hypothetical protein
MRILLYTLLLFTCTVPLLAQTPTEPYPLSPVNLFSTTVRPDLRIANPNSLKFRQFMLQVDTAADFSSPIVFQSPWIVSAQYTLNYDSMLFDQGYYWRVRSVSLTGTVYDTTAWSAAATFVTGARPRISGSRNFTFNGPSGQVSIVHAGAQRREVEADTTPEFNSPYLTTGISEGTLNTMRVHKLRFGTRYYFRYRDRTALSTSRYSDTGTITVQPTGVSFTYPSASASFYAPRLFVILQANDSLSRFEVQLDTSSLFNSPLIVSDVATRTSKGIYYEGEDLYLGTQYYIRARAITNQDSSAWTTIQPTTHYFAVLSRPLNNSTGIATNAPIESLAPNRCYVRIQLDTLATFDSPLLNDTTVYHKDSLATDYNNLSLRLRDYGFGKKYYYRAMVFNSIDTSDNWGNPYSFTTVQPFSFINSPFPNQQHVDDQIQLSWNSVKGVGGYHIQLSTDSFETAVLDKYINNADSFFTQVTLLTNTQYDARLRIFNNVDTTAWLRAVRFRTRLPLITKVSPFDSAGVANDSVPLQWRHTTPGFKYEIGIWTSKHFNNRILTDSTTDTIYYFRPPVRGKMYYWDVKAIDGDYKQPTWYYNRDWALVPVLAAPVLTSPANGATDQPVTNMRLNWNPVPDATAYRVEVDLSPSFNGPLTSTVPVNNAVLTGLPDNTLLYWRVRAANDFYGPYSSTFSFITKAFNTSVGDMAFVQPGQFLFYPNPFSNQVQISIPASLAADRHTLELYTISGQLISTTEITGAEHTLSTNGLPEGILLYRIRSENGVQTGKISHISH